MSLRRATAIVLFPTAFLLATQEGGFQPSWSSQAGRIPNRPDLSNPAGVTQRQIPSETRSVFVTGRVVTDNGAPLDDVAVIETVCHGDSRAQAYTRTDGYFSFELGRSPFILGDATERISRGIGSMQERLGPGDGGTTGGSSAVDYLVMNCDLRARFPGYTSEAIPLAMFSPKADLHVGTIIVHRLGVVEGRMVSASTLAAPKEARKAFQKAQTAVRKDKPEEAIRYFQKAVEVYPGYALAYLEIGKLQIRSGKMDEAANAFTAAIRADEKFLDPYIELSVVQALGRRWSELLQTTVKALALDPYTSLPAYVFNAVANFYLHNVDAAEKSLRKAEDLDTQHQYPQIWELLGIILAKRRDFAGAAEQMRTYLRYVPQGSRSDGVRAQLAEIEKMKGPEPPAEQQPENK